MDAQQTARAQHIFGEVMDLSPADRSAFIEEACGGDGEVRQEVLALLASMEDAGKFLSAPTVEGDPALAAATSETSPLVEQPGTVIGRYKLLQLIGEGGFGSVFMAEQEQPVRRKVALKIIKLGMDTKQVIARFEAERQALAMMDHPNIAQVFDAGATETGRPYFVMELVRGVPITTYCDENKLAPPQRMELFVQVCLAVQHAHQKGIIHRDLKPSNVLVTMHDDKPVPKVIDFGIAKATTARLTELTLFTEFRQFIGTPQYMSPEQAQLSGIDVDTRSDVYSLGVLLYELLTGTTPFTAKELREAAYEQVRKMIGEIEPPKPSTRLSDLGDGLTTVAARRATDGRRLEQLLRGELDWIVMKCLEKDRTRRYEAASALAADVKRHLADEPVLAKPSSASYRLWKFARRHRSIVLAISVALIGLVGGLAAATYGLVRATHDRDVAIKSQINEGKQRKAAEAATAIASQQSAIAVHQEEVARTAAAKAQEINRFLQSILASASPDQTMGKPVLVRDVLDQAAAKIDMGHFKDEPELEASVRQTLGRSYWSLGQYKTAELQLRKALELARKATGAESSLVASILSDLSEAVSWGGDREGAVAIARNALAMAEKVNGENSLDTAAIMENLAMDLSHVDENAEAESLARRALSIRHQRGERQSAQLAFDLALIGVTMRDDPQMQEDLLRQALAMQKKFLPPGHPDIAHTLYNLGAVLLDAGKPGEAKPFVEESLAIKRNVLGPDHPDMESGLALLRDVLLSMEDWTDLEPVLRERYSWESKYHPNEPDLDDLQYLVRAGTALAKPDQIKSWHGQLQVAIARKIASLSQQVIQRPSAAGPLEERAYIEAKFGRFRDAADDFGKASQLDPQEHTNWYLRGCLLAYLGDEAQYHATCDAMLKRFGGSSDPSSLDRTAKTCLLLPGVGQSSQATDPLDLADRALQAAGDDSNKRAWFSLCKGMALYRHARYEASIQSLEQALEPVEVSRHAMAEMFLAMAHHRLGQTELASANLSSGKRELNSSFHNAEDGDASIYGLEDWLMYQIARREAEALCSEPSR